MNPGTYSPKRASSRRTFLREWGPLSGLSTGLSQHGFCCLSNAKLKVAVIGVGGEVATIWSQVAGEEVVALCDVNQHHLEERSETHPEAPCFRDFREFHASDMDYDAVVVSTTEHTHAFAMLPAFKKGKHVYSEKPLTRDVYEARVITEAAAKAGVATQMGTQIHAGDNYRRVVELVQSGAIGEVSEVHVWVSRAWGWQTQAQAEANRDIVWSAEQTVGRAPRADTWIGTFGWGRLHGDPTTIFIFPGRSGIVGGISGTAPCLIWGATGMTALLGAEPRCPKRCQGLGASCPSGNCSCFHVRRIHLSGSGGTTGTQAHLASRQPQTRSMDSGRHPPVGQWRVVYWK